MKDKLISFFRKTYIFLPIIYIGFSFIGEENNSLYRELIYSIPFLIFGGLFRYKKNTPIWLISLLYFTHIIYDFFNFKLTHNIGVIEYYMELCIVYDFMVGLFLILTFVKEGEKQN